MELQIYMAEIDPAFGSDLEVSCIGLVERPAIERNWQAFNANKQKLKFTVNEEKRIISGPAMIANLPIYRNDPQLGEYLVVFAAPQIRQIVEKFSAKGFLKNFNLFHDPNQKVDDVTIFNSFISDKSLGVLPLAGFEDVEDGSWFLSVKINNDAVWQKVKSGEIKGFSVEGIFNYVPLPKADKMSAQDLTGSDVDFIFQMIAANEAGLQTAILVGKDSNLYEFAQASIKKLSDGIAEMKSWLVESSSMGLVMNTEESWKKLEPRLNALLNETVFHK